MAHEALQLVVGTAIVDSRFRRNLLSKSLDVLHDFALSDEESQAIIGSQADTFPALANDLNQWINSRLTAHIPGNAIANRR
jgi:hypothetical protein